MRTIGLDERLYLTAQSGRFGRTCGLWKDQIRQLKKKGIKVIPLKEVKKAYYLSYISWINCDTENNSFAKELFSITLLNTKPLLFNNYTDLFSYLKQVSSMTALSAIVKINNLQLIDDLLMAGFKYHAIDGDPFNIYVEWVLPLKNTNAYELFISATQLWLAENNH